MRTGSLAIDPVVPEQVHPAGQFRSPSDWMAGETRLEGWSPAYSFPW